MLDTNTPDTSTLAPSPALQNTPEPAGAPKPKPARRKKQRAHGEGNVYSRASDGRWCASWRVTLPNGKSKTLVAYGDTKKEAIDARAAKMQAAEQEAENATKETVGQFLRRWLESSASNLRPTSYASYEEQIRLYMAPETDRGHGLGIGGIQLKNLTAHDVDEWLSSLKKRGVSDSRRRGLYVQLKAALGRAVAWRQLKTNPMAGVECPTVKREKMEVWSPQEVARFLRACSGERLEALFFLALDTGMRQGELLGLQWEDVELRTETDETTGAVEHSGRVHIRRNLQEVNGRHQPLADPKTRNGFRTVTLAPDTARALVKHRERMTREGKGAHTYVFPSLNGTPIFKRALRDAFNRLIAKAGVKEIRFHDLRHTNATILIGSGMDIKTVSSRLGHSSIVITLDTYAKCMPEADKRAAGIMRGVFNLKAE